MSFEKLLTGGHPNSLGNTEEVVETILEDTDRFDELFHCYFSEDEVVRLRVSSAMKRICKARKDLLIPYLDRFLTEIAAIDQASTQWTLAILFDMLRKDLNEQQLKQALEIMKRNIAQHQDWIVLNTTMEVVFNWSKEDPNLRTWLIPHLERLSQDTRRSVSAKSRKLLDRNKS